MLKKSDRLKWIKDKFVLVETTEEFPKKDLFGITLNNVGTSFLFYTEKEALDFVSLNFADETNVVLTKLTYL